MLKLENDLRVAISKYEFMCDVQSGNHNHSTNPRFKRLLIKWFD
jgi:hypothetical protein